MGLSIGEIRAQCLPKWRRKVGKKSAAKLVPSSPPGRGRHARWHNAHLYRCIRPGTRVFCTEREIDALYRTRALEETNFWIFEHCDARTQRNEVMPRYEAVYKCSSSGGGDVHWVLAQKCHMLQAYSKAGRSSAECIWNIEPDGTPYWVDRYAFRKAKQRVVKKRYNSK